MSDRPESSRTPEPADGRRSSRGNGRGRDTDRPDIDPFATVLESARQAFTVADRQFRVRAFNHVAAEQIRGITGRDLVVGANLAELFAGLEEQEGLKQHFEQALTGQTPTVEREFTYRDGTRHTLQVDYFPVTDAGGQVVGACINALDVTERRCFAEALRESEERYRRLVETAEDAIFVADAESGRIVDCNRKACELLGMPTESIIGMHQTRLHPPENRDLYAKQFRNVIENGPHTVWTREVVRGDGTRVPVGIAANVYEAVGRRFVLGIFRDMTESVRAEQALCQSEERFRRLFEQAADAMFVHDRRGRIVDANQAACRALGYTRDELLTMRVADVDREVDLQWAERTWEKVSSGDTFSFESEHRRKDGTTFPVELSVGGFDWGGRACVLAIARDTSQRRQALEELEHRQERDREFRDRLEALTHVTAELTRCESGETLCRRAVELGRERLGFERLGIWLTTDQAEEFRGSFGIDERGNLRDERDVRIRIDPEDPVWDVIRQARSLVSWERGVLFDHHLRPVGEGSRHAAGLWDGREMLGFLAADNLFSGRAISPEEQELLTLYASFLGHLWRRIAVSEELQRSEQRFRELIELLPAMVLEMDTDCRIMLANRSAFAVSGYEPEDVEAGLNAMDLLIPADRAQADEDRRRVLNGWAGGPLEYTVIRKNGGTFPVSLQVAPIEADGEVVGIRSVALDLTERRRLEEQLRQEQKMKAIGRLAAGVAHNFRTHLTVIRGYCDLLTRSGPQDQETREALEQIRAAADEATATTTELLTFTRSQAFRPEIVDVCEFLRDLAGPLGPMMGDEIEVAVGCSAGDCSVLIDPTGLKQALMNLAANARDAMPDGGRFRVRAERVELTEADVSRHTDVRPGTKVMIVVSDTGVGMDAETLANLFEPFFTTKPVGSGIGLGLASVYGFIQQNGGHVEVESEPDAGSTFRLYLPARSEPPGAES